MTALIAAALVLFLYLRAETIATAQSHGKGFFDELEVAARGIGEDKASTLGDPESVEFNVGGVPGLASDCDLLPTRRMLAGRCRSGQLRISHPYTVSLRRRLDVEYFCAGVLISRRHVLTAAHCVDPTITSADDMPLVVAGSPSSSKALGSRAQVIPTRAVVPHPDYQSRRFPDLAILELAADVDQRPIRLPARFLPREGDALDIIGWGRKSSSSDHAETVQVASVGFVPKRICRGKIGRPIMKHEICVGGQGVSSCEGDDGGPIVLPGMSRRKDVLVGIVGGNHVCGRIKKPGVHTNVWPYVEWIDSTIGRFHA